MGFGLLAWILDKPTDDDRIATILDERPTAIWLSFGSDLGKYVKRVSQSTAGCARRDDDDDGGSHY